MRLLFCLLPVSLLAQPTPNFQVEVVDNQIGIGYGLAIGDVDGDRLPDILMADQHDIVWYKNPGGQFGGRPSDGVSTEKLNSRWTRYVMARNLTPQDNVCIAARDLNSDGKVEVAVGAGWNPAETTDSTKSGAVFYLVRPADPTQIWEPVRLPHEVTTHRMRWVRTGRTNYQLVVVPLHGLGNKNGEGRGVRIWGYEFPKDPHSRWKQHLVDSTMHLTHNFEAWEDDYSTGIIIGGKEGGKIVLWKKGQWHRDTTDSATNYLGSADRGVGIGEIKRLDGGNAIVTIQPMHGNRLQVEPGSYKFSKVRAILPDKLIDSPTDKMNQGHALVCADWLGIGRDQIAVGWRNSNAEGKVGTRLFRPDMNGKWTEFSIDDSVRMACEDMQTADLDGDGDLDLVASGRSTLNVLIYWNKRIP